MAVGVTPDAVTRLFKPQLSGFFGLDGYNIPIAGVDHVYLVAHDLRRGDLPSAFLASKQDPTESLENCREFVKQFRSTVEGIGTKIKQIILDDRVQLWQGCQKELPPNVVATLDVQHFLANIERKKLPERCRSAKSWGLVAELEYALRRSPSKGDAERVIEHILSARPHWLEGETNRVREGTEQTLEGLQRNTDRLLSHFDLLAPGNRLHYRTTNPTESAIGILADTIKSISCFQSEQLAAGQLNLISLINRLRPTTKDKRSVLQKCRVNKTLADLMPILQAFNPKSPVR